MIRHSKPIILYEINPKAARGLGLEPYGAWEFLQSLGYNFFKLQC